MPVKVVDASAIGALVFGEPEAEAVSVAISDCIMTAPSLIWYELSSICLKKIGKQPDKKANLLRAFRLAKRLPIEMAAIDHIQIINLAEEKTITTYDASYLWITQQLGVELVTLDKKLRKAAKT
jgi:predicted nucleic acid-binding protein